MATDVLALLCIWLHVSSVSECHRVFSLHPQNQSVTEDGTVTFTCHANFRVNLCQDEKLAISWIRDTVFDSHQRKVSRCNISVSNLTDIERYSVYLNSTGNLTIYSLVINNVTSADSGEYFCSISKENGGSDASKPAFLTVTNQSICQNNQNLSIRVTQMEELTVGSEGTFRCDIDPLQNSSTVRWLMKKEANQAIFLNNDGRFATSANRLTISPVLVSDNGSQILCQAKFSIMYTTDCKEFSQWYHMLVVPQTRDDSGLNFPKQLPTQPLNAISPTQSITDADTGLPMILWLIIGGILALLILVATILSVTYRCTHRKPRNRPNQVDQAAPTLRRFIPNARRDSHIHGDGSFSTRSGNVPDIGRSIPLSSAQHPADPQLGDIYAAVSDTRMHEPATRPESSQEHAGNGGNKGRIDQPEGTPTRVQFGEDLYTVRSKVKLDNAEYSDSSSGNSSKSSVAPVGFQVGEDLYTVPNKVYSF